MKKKKNAVFQPVQTAEQKRKRIRNIVITAVVLVIAAAACYFAMPKNKDLSQSSIFDRAEVEALAQQVVTYINDGNYAGLKEMSVSDMESIMNEERMNEAKARVSEDWGAFKDIKDITATEVTQRGVTAAVAYVSAEYENAEIHFTFAFNEDMKLASLGIQ